VGNKHVTRCKPPGSLARLSWWYLKAPYEIYLVASCRPCLFCPRRCYFIFSFKHFTWGIIFSIRDALIYIF